MPGLKEIGMQKKEIGNIIKIIFSAFIIVIMISGLVKTVFFPKDINYYENRPAKKIGKPDVQSYITSEFQNSLEESLSDQIPLAQSLKKMYNSVNSKLLVASLMKQSEKHPEEYYKYNDVMIHDGYILWKPFDLEECRSEFEKTAASFNRAAENNPDTDFSLYYIESDSIYDFQSNEKMPVYEYVKGLLDFGEDNLARFELNSFEQYKEEFYRTDHHWNHKGSYRGYQEILKLLKCDEAPSEPLREIELPYQTAGSKAKESGLTEMKEYPSVYEFDFPDLGAPYGSQEEIISGAVKDFTYEMFYGVNLGEYEFDSGREDRENILIIGDSFDNAVLKLIAQHYNKTCSVDLRNLETEDGAGFNVTDYIREKEIDKILIIASQVIFSSGEYILES